jgi:anti-sigma B factor antagonist
MAERLFYIRGDIDATTAPGLKDALEDVVTRDDTDLLVDCGDLTFIDSQGISVLISAQNLLQARGRSLRVVNAKPMTARVMDLTGLVEFLRVNESGTPPAP